MCRGRAFCHVSGVAAVGRRETAGHQIPAVGFGTAVLAAREVFPGPLIYRLAGGSLGDQGPEVQMRESGCQQGLRSSVLAFLVQYPGQVRRAPR